MGFFLALLPVFAAASSATVAVKSVQLTGDGTHTELLLSLSGNAEHTLFTLSQPNRIVLDVDDAELKAALPPGRGMVSTLRSATHDDKLRLVLDLNTRAMPQSFLRQTAAGPELVVEMTAPGATPVASVPAPASAVPTAAVIAAPAMPTHGRDIVVAIDAGHGGRDPGAHGPKGAYEKNVTLAIAKKLAALIDRQPGMKAVLTRDSDVYVDLKERFMKARRADADLFVSIHCDAARDKSADGATVYVVSEHGATTEHARFLERQENDALVGGVDLKGLAPDVKSVVVDMSQSAVMVMSFDVGGSVAKQLAAIGAMHKDSVQQAGFMVLKAPDVPSMLIETNYITNPHTAKLLMSNDYQQQLASAIFTGIDSYFGHYPPPGSQLAVLKQQRDGRTSGVLASGVGLNPNR
ncbi:MAG TPA: N-acetylmuramoyl-L-alanine amidase [Gammaproteobacteria bacterium]|jgi:N-acetylmuramoyl-L-alanine amidase|nr:N-acetylmuramoyl-L-alanine amidase [Gammaproteobacteria bacterium]